MNRILFLDVDGVCNSSAYLYGPDSPEKTGRWAPGDPMRFALEIEPRLVALLNEVVVATGCRVVISSSWRHAHTPDRMQAYLRARGFVGEVIGETPYYVKIADGVYGPRSAEIALWLREHEGEVSSYAIVDDGSDAGVGMEDRFVKTDVHVGLTLECVEALIRILSRDA